MSDVGKILSMVDVLGSADNLARYRKAVEQTLPKDQQEQGPRFWRIYSQLADKFLQDPKVTNKGSIITCMFNAPKLGLNPDPVFGQIFFIPYKGVLTYQVGYKGYVALAYRSGVIVNIRAGLVYEKEMQKWHFFEDELGQHFHHEPILDFKRPEDRGRRVLGYSIFTDIRGHNAIHTMDGYHIDEIKKLVLARMGDASTPWKNPLFEPEMEKKTVVRRHAKYEPFSAEMVRITEHEEANERGELSKEDHPELDEVMDELVKKSGAAQMAPENLSAELDAQAAREAK